MLNLFVGNIDIAAGFVLVAIFAGGTIIVTSMIMKRRSTLEINHEFELGKMRQRDAYLLDELKAKQAHESALAKIGSNRDIEIKRIDGGMITSHTSSTEGQG